MVHEVAQMRVAGDPAAAQLRLHMLRLAAALVLESCDADVVAAVQLHLLQLANAR